jgi:hypothetical protein
MTTLGWSAIASKKESSIYAAVRITRRATL